MASHGVGEPALPNSGPSPHHHLHHHHQYIPYGVPHMLHPSNTSFINQEGPAFDFGELEEAIVLQGVKINNHDDTKQPLYSTARPAATLEMFPSWPIRFEPTPQGGSSRSGEESTDSGSAVNTLSSRGEESPTAFSGQNHHLPPPQPPQDHQQTEMAGVSATLISGNSSQAQPKPVTDKRRGTGSNTEKVLDAKTLRRLAQNREAARKSRLRKKAYVQQLETSRVKLAQLEQDLQRARAQGLFIGGAARADGNISSGAVVFDMEYARWLDDDHRYMTELRTALQAHLCDGDLRVIVDKYIDHYDEIFRLKGIAAKADVFHLITGMWVTPAERCFLWMGGFRPSDLIKMLMSQLDPLTEQQVMGIYSLQQSSQQAEEALSQGLEQLQQTLVQTVANGAVNDTMHNMAMALNKLATLESFVHQADNLRQQTLHQLRRILTVRQATRCFLVIGEYYGRLRALSSLWASRPRETMIPDDTSCQTTTDLHMMQAAVQNQFPNF